MKRRRSDADRLMFLTFDFADENAGALERVATVERLLERDPVLSRIPVHWRIASAAFDPPTPESLLPTVSRLRTRIASCTDLILPAGYSAIPHPVLLPSDVGLDLLWATETPDTGARRDVFAGGPVVVFPSFPDLRRATTERAYHNANTPILISHESYGEIVCSDASPIPLSILRYDRLRPRKPEAGARKTPVAELVVLIIDGIRAIEAIRTGTLGRVVTRLEERGGCRFALVSELLENSGRTKAEAESLATRRSRSVDILTFAAWNRAVGCVYSREQLSRASRQARRRVDGAMHEAPFEPVDTDTPLLMRGRFVREAPTPERERVLVSDMTGEITMAGDSIRAAFRHGHLTGLGGADDLSVVGVRSRSHITIDNESKSFELESAFSFEEPGARGLQERFVCDVDYYDGPIKLDVGFIFLDLARQLFLSIKTSFPSVRRPATVDTFRPFDLEIDMEEGPGHYTAHYPDGESISGRIAAPTQLDYLWGTSFVITAPRFDIVLFTPERRFTGISCLPVTASISKRVERLTIGLGAVIAPAPADGYSGSVYESLFGFDLADPGSGRPPVVPTAVTERLERSYPAITRG